MKEHVKVFVLIIVFALCAVILAIPAEVGAYPRFWASEFSIPNISGAVWIDSAVGSKPEGGPRVHLVFETTGKDIYYSYSDDTGVTWSNPVKTNYTKY
ncbi:MAG: hypothetical protein PHP64_04575 [Actinomycetota bacterium]|nr:hypothetical protein [Actinomycetota bacterium]